jgi:phosphoribosylaminoimidazole carboxylase PurE protein
VTAGGPRVAIIVGSRSDLDTMARATETLSGLAIESETRVLSAHRSPALLEQYLERAEARGVEVFVCAAGLAAHLPGVVASRTVRPVIGVPLAGGVGDGLDALLSIVQMPRGVPVATVGVGNAVNAGLLAAAILALADEGLRERLGRYREEQARAVAEDPQNRDDS